MKEVNKTVKQQGESSKEAVQVVLQEKGRG